MGSKKKTTIALGTAMALGLAASPAFSATSSPFQMQSLRTGYLLAKAESKPAPESKPATGSETKPKDGHCGSMKDKDGHCGTKMKDGKCGETKPSAGSKVKDGKCGEGTCGSNKKK